jgi:two-component system NtrC family sensor kinase
MVGHYDTDTDPRDGKLALAFNIQSALPAGTRCALQGLRERFGCHFRSGHVRLALKVVLATVLGTLAVLVLFGYLRMRREVALFDYDIRNDHALIGTTLAVCVASTWSAAGAERALGLVEQANADREYLTIRWVYPDDGLLTLNEHHPRFPLGALEQVDHRVLSLPSEDGERDVLVTHVPVRDKGVLIGAIEIAESLVVRDAYLRSSILSTVFVTASMVLISGVVVLVFGVWLVGRPLGLLADKAKRIGRGDLTEPLALAQHDEIGELAREVNAMCERLVEVNAKTEREALARIAALEQLRHADRLITVGRLAAGVAHELGTPLNVIAGRVKMLRRGNLDPKVVCDYLGIIGEQAERMTSIIRQLMDFARRREPKAAAADLLASARAIRRLVQPIADKGRVDVAVTSTDVVWALGDPVQLEQVMSNLVVNAIHACSAGGRVEISCGLRGDGERARAFIRVEDDGHGMDSATRERIFEPFFTTKDVGQGTGLGLSVAHGIVQEHGGSIEVESEPKRGSRFSVFLPLASREPLGRSPHTAMSEP